MSWLRVAVAALLLGLAASLAGAATVKQGPSAATAAAAVATSAEKYVGDGSWYNDATKSKAEYYAYWNGSGTEASNALGTFTIADIATISYRSKHGARADELEFCLAIYTEKLPGQVSGWYGSRLTAEPMYSANYSNHVDGQWNLFTTDVTASDVQLRFYDSAQCGNYGYYGEPTLQDLQAGEYTWPTGNKRDYRTETVKGLNLFTGSAWNASFLGYLDAIIVTLKDGRTVTVDLEAAPGTAYVDDDFTSATPGWGYDHFAKIQDAINAVPAGGTVNVAAGAYAENLSITKGLTLQGAGKDTTTVTAVADNTPTVKVDGSAYSIVGALKIDGFTLKQVWMGTGDDYIVLSKRLGADCTFTLSGCRLTDCKNFGLWDSYSNCTLNVTNNVFDNMNAPILVEHHPSGAVTISGNDCSELFYDDDYGWPIAINPLTYDTDGTCNNAYTISGNTIHDYEDPGYGIVVIGGASWESLPPAKYTNLSISNNTISPGAGSYVGIYLYNASADLKSPAGGTQNAQCSGNVISGCANGLYCLGDNPGVVTRDTYGADLTRFIRLNGDAMDVDARSAVFQGANGGAQIEAKVYHKVDDASLGWVLFDANQLSSPTIGWDVNDGKFYFCPDATNPAAGLEVGNGSTYYYRGDPITCTITGIPGDKTLVVNGAAQSNSLRMVWYLRNGVFYRGVATSTIGGTPSSASYQRGMTYANGVWQPGLQFLTHSLSGGPTWTVTGGSATQVAP
jgi:hypothetical protein